MKTFLFIHGALGTSSQWKQVAAHFSEHKVFNINLPYHGYEPGTRRNFTVNELADYLGGLLEGEDLQDVVIAGYSLGGYIGMKLMSLYPDRVSGLMTYGTKFHWNSEIAAKETAKISAENLMQKAPDFIAELKQLHGPDWGVALEKVSFLMTDLGSGGALNDADFANLQAKVVLCVGENDRMVSTEETAEISKKLQGSEMKIVSDGKHPLDSVDPIFFVNTLLSI